MPRRSSLISLVLLVTGAWTFAAPHAAAAACSVPTPSLPTVQSAINAASCDPINVAAGVFAEHIAISRNVTIDGAGAGLTFLDGGGSSGTPVVDTAAGTIELSDMTIRNGASSGGAGIRHLATMMTLRRVVVSDNHSPAAVGGIYQAQAMSIVDSLVANNSAIAQAGGIFSDAALTITGSTISGNDAGTDGAGLYQQFGTISITESTISDNDALLSGGGIRAGTSLDISSSTITDNTADADSNASGDGGGIYQDPAAVVKVRSTILGGNVDTSMEGPDCYGMLTSEGHTLIRDNTGCAVTQTGSDDQIGTPSNLVDPGLAALANNGGPTPMHALLPTSTARDAGAPAPACGAIDQRGLPRPQGAACDIGAYELLLCGGLPVTSWGTAGADELTGTPNAEVIHSLGGDDTIDGGGGTDKLCGGDGVDVLTGGIADDVFDGGAGDDGLLAIGDTDFRLTNTTLRGLGNDIHAGFEVVLLIGGDRANTIDANGFAGLLLAAGGGGRDLLRGGIGSDLLFGDGGGDQLAGGPGRDVLLGGPGRDRIAGGGGRDVLLGGPGRDRIAGGRGRDRLSGGEGADALYGGGGSDRCRGGSGPDTLVSCER